MSLRFTRRRALQLITLAPAAAACTPVAAIPPPEHAPRRGADQPELVVHEVGDYQCSFCAQAQPAVDQLMNAYGHRVMLAWRNYPLPRHEHAQLAAEAALEVRAQKGDAVFWNYHRMLLKNQHALQQRDLERYAETVGGDLPRFRSALEQRVHQAAVQADKQAIDEMNLPSFGTPAFLIGDDVFIGSYSYQELAGLVEEKI